MRRWLLALVLAAAGLPEAQARDALGAIDACLRQLDRNLDVGYPHIAARCPELAPSLAQSEWAAWLPRDWNRPDSLLSADGLTELRTLLTSPPSAAADAREPEDAAVAEAHGDHRGIARFFAIQVQTQVRAGRVQVHDRCIGRVGRRLGAVPPAGLPDGCPRQV